ncbi:hypothetical protein AVEN_159462-1 [Araneus ventricosus]|uniref:Uncharacterized protein n=1 Tax=Araneus ventricosus TaxID=182803 RepID=A0A4Y2A130_ARAVE|nr:hypothetical protein AVEN_159462-1 [Araneus ventricosus]
MFQQKIDSKDGALLSRKLLQKQLHFGYPQMSLLSLSETRASEMILTNNSTNILVVCHAASKFPQRFRGSHNLIFGVHLCFPQKHLTHRVLAHRNNSDVLSDVAFSLQSIVLIKKKCQNKFIAVRRAQLAADKQTSRTCHFHQSTPKRSGSKINLSTWNSLQEVGLSSASSTLGEASVEICFQ